MLLRFLLSLFLLLLSATGLHAQKGGKQLTLTVDAYTLPQKDAAPILLATPAQTGGNRLLEVVTNAHAKVEKLGTIQTTSGKRATSQDSKQNTRLEADIVLGPDGVTVHFNIAVDIGRKQVVTAVAPALGSSALLGVIPDDKTDTVRFIFASVTSP